MRGRNRSTPSPLLLCYPRQPVSLVVTCAPCDEVVLEAEVFDHEEECLLRDHLLLVQPRTISARDPRRVAQAFRRHRIAAAGSVTAPRYRPQPLDLAQEFGEAVQLDLGGGGVSLRRFAAGGGCSLPVVLARLPWAVDAQCNQHASCRGRRWSRWSRSG